jgi:polyvinyl alcohol dehydrogenase (cytochrome)
MKRVHCPLLRVLAVLALSTLCGATFATGLEGLFLYETKCSVCHDHAVDRAPPRALIERRQPHEIVLALTSGAMRPQAAGLSVEQIRSIAMFLTQKDLSADEAAPAPESNTCSSAGHLSARAAGNWNGWGRDLDNSRYQNRPGFRSGEVGRLKLKWAYAYRGTITYGQPTVVGDWLYATSSTGRVYALDARSGCTHWTIDVERGVRTAVSVAPLAHSGRLGAYFGDDSGNVYAVDATSGARLWTRSIEQHPSARITGSPIWNRGRLYVPVSSSEEGVGRSEIYPCCSFRGSIVALDAGSGEMLWKSFNITDEPRPYRKNAVGTQLLGPAGAATWAAPTMDARGRTLYIGTGNSYTSVEALAANAVIALDAVTGAHRWVQQTLQADNYLVLCMQPGVANCPEPLGPDNDFGSPMILRHLKNGRNIVVAGQKSGMVYGLDADTGKLLWQTRVGRGGPGGGVEWGMAADDRYVYASVSDQVLPPATGTEGGLTALRIDTGEQAWHAPAPAAHCSWSPPANCSAAQSAAVSVIPGVVFAGSVDGHLRAYATRDGAILWDYDTAHTYQTVNQLPASGGSIDATGPVIANGMLYVNSGYGKFNGAGGNVLLAFEIDRSPPAPAAARSNGTP